jgi:hypothetical protein
MEKPTTTLPLKNNIQAASRAVPRAKTQENDLLKNLIQ